MVRKLLFILTLFITTIAFTQNTEAGTTMVKSQIPVGKTITNVTAFPNPLNNKSIITFTSSLEQTVYFEVKNVLGKSVYKLKFLANSGSNEISFLKDNLTAGMYVYSIQSDTEIVSKRLVIK
jgi:hypothetical protein